MKYLFTIIFSFFITLNSFAEDLPINELNQTQSGVISGNSQCEYNKYEIVGEFDSKINNNLVFSIKNNLIGQSNSGLDITYTLKKDGKVLQEKKQEKFSTSFQDPGNIILEAKIIEKGYECEYNLSKEINIYTKIISIVSDNQKINLSFDDDFYKNNILLNKLILDNKSTTSFQDKFLSTLTEKLYLFNDSDIIVVDSESYLQILQGFEKLKDIYNINFSNKKIYIVTDSSFIFSKKILNNFIESLNTKVYTFPPHNLLNFLNYISTGESSENLLNNKNYSLNAISYDSSKNKLLLLSNFTNKLISSGFPMGILGIIFSLALAVTTVNFIRQFIGFSIFSLYYPLFIALSLYIFSFELTLILTLASFFSIYFNKIIFGKTHFLVNAKLSLYFITYLIISIVLIWIFNVFKIIDFGDIKTNMIIFPFSIIPMVIYRVFADERKIFSWGFVFYVFEFLFVTLISYLIIKSNFIQNLFLAYSELLILLFFINILIGKFSGLQVLEYIRFIPLIKRHFNSEE